MGYLFTFCFICFDYITGLYKAGATRHFSSKVMRQGLWHKAGLVLMMCAGFLVDYAQKYVDIGIHVPVGGGVCVYIILMELVSALENICQGNPEIMPDKLCVLFGVDVRTAEKSRPRLLAQGEGEPEQSDAHELNGRE